MADFRNIANAQGSKGLRNNNPLNINAAGWKGQVAVDGSEAVFSDTIFGFRAAAFELLKYFNTYGLTTINEIAARWAPVADGNDPVDYAHNVAAAMGVGVDDPLTLDAAQLNLLMDAMMIEELGSSYANQIDQTDIGSGIAMLNLPALTITQSANGSGGLILMVGIFAILMAVTKRN